MTRLSERALQILQEKHSPQKQRFTENDLIMYGFSESEAKIIIKELEEKGMIVVDRSYISLAFELL